MKNINITVENKRAAVVGSPTIVCGNSDYTVTFTFDNEWSLTGPKTARFVYVKHGEVMHEDKVFSGKTVAVPVLSDVAFVNVGVFAGDLCTTTPARVSCRASILCGSGIVQEPTPDVYSQIMKLFDDMAKQGAFGATEAQAQQIEQNKKDIAAIEAGTKKAGDANKLGGFTAKQVGQSSARNIIEYPYNGSTSGTGIEWIDHGNGTIGVRGTATKSASFVIRAMSENWILPKGEYSLSGCPSGGSFGTYRLMLARNVDGTLTSYANEYGTGATFTVTDELPLLLQFVVAEGVTIDATIQPMMEPGIVGHDFMPYYSGGADIAKRALHSDESDYAHYSDHAGNAEKVNGFTVYTSIEQLGLTSYSIPGIVKALPVGSMYLDKIVHGSAYANEAANALPTGYTNGALEILKPYAGRTRVLLSAGTNTSKTRVYYCDLDETNWVVNGWNHTADGGNADKLDGYDSADFMKLNENGGTISYTDYNAVKIKRNSTNPSQIVGFVFANDTGNLGMVGFRNGKLCKTGMAANDTDSFEILDVSNSAKVHIGTAAPSDTTALWVDTNE